MTPTNLSAGLTRNARRINRKVSRRNDPRSFWRCLMAQCLLWIVELRTCLSKKMSAKTCQESRRSVVSTCLNRACWVLPSMTRTGRAPQAAAWPCGVGTLRWCGAQNGRELPLSMHRSKIEWMDVTRIQKDNLCSAGDFWCISRKLRWCDTTGERGISAVSGKPLSFKGSRPC